MTTGRARRSSSRSGEIVADRCEIVWLLRGGVRVVGKRSKSFDYFSEESLHLVHLCVHAIRTELVLELGVEAEIGHEIVEGQVQFVW